MPATGRSNFPNIAREIRNGAVIILPTETVYGIGASPFCREAIQRIYALKGRAWRKPLALLTHSLEAAAPLIESIPPEARRLAKMFCPGPITLVLKASPLGQMLMGGLPTIGVRIPDHPIALRLLRSLGTPLATTSVNRSGQKPAVSASGCRKVFSKGIDRLIDGGACRVKEPSSVIDFSHYPFTVIREGALSKQVLEQSLLRTGVK